MNKMNTRPTTYLTEWSPGEVQVGDGKFARLRGQYKFTMTEVSKVPDAKQFANIMKICCKCHKVPAQLMYSCTLGHVTCSECVSNRCLCEHAESHTTQICSQRLKATCCHAFSTVLNDTTIVCSRCTTFLEGRHISNHEHNCLGNLPCGFTRCLSQKRFTKKSLIKHLTDEHGVHLYKPRNGRIIYTIVESMYSRDIGCWKIPFLMEFDDTMFICAYGREIVDNVVALVIIVYYIAMDDKGPSYKTYHGTIKLSSGQSYTGSFCNIKNVDKHLIRSCRCLIVPVEPISHGHGRHRIHLTVNNGFSDEEGYSLENLFQA